MCRYLPAEGWTPRVITTQPMAGVAQDQSLLEGIPAAVKVDRTIFFEPFFFYRSLKKRLGLVNSSPTGAGEALPSPDTGRSENRRQRSLMKKIKLTIVGILSTPDHLVFWVPFAVMRGIRVLLRERDIKFVLTTSPPHSSQLAGAILSRLFGKPHIVDLRDPWNDIYWGDYGRLRSRIELLLETAVIRHASKVMSSTESYTKLLQERFKKADSGKFVTLTNCYEREKFDRIAAEVRPKFTMCYLGIFYPFYNPYTFFEALAQWLEEAPAHRTETELVIVGDGDEVTRDVIQELRLGDVATVTGRVPHDEAIRLARSADLLLLLLGVDEKAPPGCIPSKLFEYLACGKPILAHVPEGEAAAIVRQTRAGYVITTDDVSEMKRALDREYSRKKAPDGLRSHRARRRDDEIFKYSSDYSVRKMTEFFASVCGRSPRSQSADKPGELQR